MKFELDLARDHKRLCMLIYKFRATFENQDEFLREIELRADQTFEDFHQAILGNLGLDPGMLASFYMCDHRYRKLREIHLIDNESAPIVLDDDLEQETLGKKPLLMHECALKDFIDDPHQRLMFVYDQLNNWTFFIEMIKILPADKATVYPRFSKSVGPVPRELIATPKQMPGVENNLDFLFEREEELPGDLSDYDQIEGEDDFMGEDPEEPTDESTDDQ